MANYRALSCAFAAILCTACQSIDVQPTSFQRAQNQTEAEIAFVKNWLDSLQTRSIAQNREYCGYIGVSASGDFIATPPRKGRKSSCRADEAPDDFLLLASYHTHGGFAQRYESELPSTDDLRADIEEGVDGYIATPGGRIWFNDARKETAAQLCGEGCITADSNFDASDSPDIKARYTLEALHAAEE